MLQSTVPVWVSKKAPPPRPSRPMSDCRPARAPVGTRVGACAPEKELNRSGNGRNLGGSDGVEEIQQLLALNRKEEEKAVTRRSCLAIMGADSCVQRRGASVVKIRGAGAHTPQGRGPHFALVCGSLRYAIAETAHVVE